MSGLFSKEDKPLFCFGRRFLMEKQVVEMTPREFTKMINEKDTKEEFMIAVDLLGFAEKKNPLSDGKENKPSVLEGGEIDG